MTPMHTQSPLQVVLNSESHFNPERLLLMQSFTASSLILKLTIASLILLQTLAHASPAGADDHTKPDDRQSVCFNLVCKYSSRMPQDGGALPDGMPSSCRAAAVFTKDIGMDGGELFDVSDADANPDFEVECDNHVIFNDRGHRFTDAMGTRIQALTGPYPALLLPRGALRDTRGYINSNLDLDGRVLSGYCYLYTGPQ